MRLDHLLSREEEVRKCVLLFRYQGDTEKILVAMRLWGTPVPIPWGTPVPIPNTTVKTQAADGTALETVWESRWPPDHKKETAQGC